MAGRMISAPPDDLYRDALQRGGDVSKTGRYVVTFKPGVREAGTRMLQTKYGLKTASAADFESHAVVFDSIQDTDGIILPEIGVAILGGEAFDEHQVGGVSVSEADSDVDSVDAEYFAFALDVNPSDYLKGFVRAAQVIAADLQKASVAPSVLVDIPPALTGVTWGLAACQVPSSRFSGNGISVAMLDTGLDFNHPDFLGRSVVGNSFVGQPPQDLHGHGTHTTGTACGTSSPPAGNPRYGIGCQTKIFVGKVLSNTGVSVAGSILAGMNWAIANGCQVISMSLRGLGPVQPAYTSSGAAALSKGCLIIAGAGNDSHRPAQIAPTGSPANSPTIMSVAALDQNLQVAPFSNGGKIDIAGPGVNVLSSVPRPKLYGTMSGTSMATPHVSGVAALYAESDPSLRGNALWSMLQSSAKKLPFPPTDVGAGLVQAPQ
jgi:subtilisin